MLVQLRDQQATAKDYRSLADSITRALGCMLLLRCRSVEQNTLSRDYGTRGGGWKDDREEVEAHGRHNGGRITESSAVTAMTVRIAFEN